MSLIDQMKLQAQQVLEARKTEAAFSKEVLAQRNAKLKAIFDYWHEFSGLIKVLEPNFPHEIEIPRIGVMKGLKVQGSFADYRYKLLRNNTFTEEIDYATIFFFYKGSQTFKFKRELGAAEHVKDILWRYGIVHHAEDIRNAQARAVEVAFDIPWQVKGSVLVTPLPDSEVLHFSLKNIGKVGEAELEMPFHLVDSIFLDELSKLLLGQDNSFWKLVKF